MTAEPDQTAALAEVVEQYREACAAVPGALDEAAAGVGEFAFAVADLVQEVDARRKALNEWARSLNAEPVPDFLAACDGPRARLLTAARRGPAAASVALGKAARRPASEARPEAAPEPAYTGASIDVAGEAAAALLTAVHHHVIEVDPAELMGGAHPIEVAIVLAGITLRLAKQLVPDVDAWLIEAAADNAQVGEDR